MVSLFSKKCRKRKKEKGAEKPDPDADYVDDEEDYGYIEDEEEASGEDDIDEDGEDNELV